MRLRNLLLVSYQFPPIGGSGVQRAVKLARHLPAAGWRVHVLHAGGARHSLTDATLLQDIGTETVAHAVRGLDPAGLAARACAPWRRRGRTSAVVDNIEQRLYWRLDRTVSRLRLPEAELLWVPSAIKAARRIVRQHGIEAVVTTSPANAVHLVGRWLRRRLGIPWIADMRDPIVGNFAYAPRTNIEDRFWHWLEPEILQTADRVVVTCPELVDDLRDRWGERLTEGMTTITNGFDPCDGPDIAERARPGPGAPFVLAHVGAFYRQQSVGPILEAARLFLRRRPDAAGRFELRLVGSVSAEQRRLFAPGDASFVRQLGYRTHREAIEEMAAARALMLTTPDNAGGRLCIPAKAFEYLAFGPHILGRIHADTALSRLLQEAGNATVVADRHPQALAAAIEGRFDRWAEGVRDEHRDRIVVDRYRRDRLARRFAAVVESAVDGRPTLRIVGASDAAGDAA